MPDRKKTGRTGGFTLLELLVVMAIISLAIGLIPALFSAAMPGTRLKGATHDLAAGLRIARSQAITENQTITVSMAQQDASYRIGDRKIQRLPDGVRLAIATPESPAAFQDTPPTLQFFPDGSSSGSRITLSMKQQGYRINVDWLTGRVDIEETLNAEQP